MDLYGFLTIVSVNILIFFHYIMKESHIILKLNDNTKDFIFIN